MALREFPTFNQKKGYKYYYVGRFPTFNQKKGYKYYYVGS